MNSLYIAVNGDDVGKKIGQAIISDDHDSLQSTSDMINSSHNMIGEWVESIGGRTITSSGDEGIYEIPAEAAGELEGIRQKYQQMSQHTLTIGCGSSISEASKALIYGKLNAKDQIVQYDENIEQYLSPEAEQQVPMEESGLEEDPTKEVEEDLGNEEIQKPATEFNGQHGEELSEEPMHEQDMSPKENLVHDAAENHEDEIDHDNIEADEELGEDGIDGVNYEGDDSVEEAGSEMEDGQESHSEMLENMVSAHMEEDGEEAIMSENDMEEAVQEESMESEIPVDEEQMKNEGGDLQSEIADVLMTFKENKHLLEQARETSPELYDANVSMLRLMCEMAKQLGMEPTAGVEEAPMEEAVQEEPMEESEEAPVGEGEAIVEDGEDDEKKQEGKSDK